MNALLLSSVVLVCGADDPPKPKVPVGKETTHVTGPLDKHGYIDYEVALNERLKKGVTPDTNANALLWQAFGPTPEGGRGMPAEYFKQLGIPEPPKDGDYFIGGFRFRTHAGLDDEEGRAFDDDQSRAARRPWTAKDYPRVAEWLKANEKPLAVVVEATRRPAYFNPLASVREDGASSNVIACLLPNVQKCRELAAALTARAMLKLADGKPEEAWADLLACHRLGRHLMRGGTLIETLVGIAVRAVANNATLAYLERADLTSQQLLARLKELQALLPAPPMADKIDLCERLACLDSLQLVRSGRHAAPNKPPTDEQLRALDAIDWEPAFRKANKLYDRMAAAMRLSARADRQKELGAIEKELDELVKKNRKADDLRKQLFAGDPGQAIGGEIGDVLLALMVPAVRKVQGSEDRAAQLDHNLHIAFALAAYHKDNGRYPAKLADLAPKYLAAVPGDLFSGKVLVYKRPEKGYTCYSVGVNGKDDNGQTYGDDPPGDDLGLA
ncbi:MAG: hypothetical protein K2V38_08170, partial [Gemmataceae bacterium]|nr:hypothetical protein [Gemmataceae bacterium]